MSVFVGRTEELSVLADLAAQVERGPSAALILGDPGSGKTRLLREVAARLNLPSVLRVVGHEPEQGVPLAASADLLRTLGDVPRAGPRLTSLVFEAEDTSALEPVRVFEAAHRALAGIEPAAVFVDDLQWVDELSFALCHYVVRAAEATGQQLSLIVAARPSAQAASLATSLSQMLSPDRMRTIELGPLGPEEALELVKTLAPALDRERAHQLAEKAEGSPFWLEALVRTAGADVDAGQLVTARLRGAGSDAVTVLSLLAIAARPLSLIDIATLEGWETERSDRAARELVTRGVAVHSGGALQLAHDLIRSAALAGVPTETRGDIHRRLAQWLERLAGEDLGRLREALDHRHAAGLPALELATRLACSAHRTLLGDEGLALLTRIADDGDVASEPVLTLIAEVAQLATELARYDVALERWSLLAEYGLDTRSRAAALLGAAQAAFALNNREAGRTYLARARALDIDDELFALELDTHEASAALWSGDEGAPSQALAREVSQRAHQMVEGRGGVEVLDVDARRVYLGALRVEHGLAFQEDDIDRLLTVSERTAAVARGFDTTAQLEATIAGARALRRMGRLGESEQRLRHVWEEGQRRVLPQVTIDAAYWLGTVLEQRGQIAQAEEIVADAVELAARVGDAASDRHQITRLAHKIAFHRGEWRAAISDLQAEGRGASTHARIEFHQDVALWLAVIGGQELEPEISASLADARACAAEAACPRCATELRLAAAEVLVRIGRWEESAESLALWEAAQKHPQVRDRVLQARIKALLEARDGNGTAIAALETVADEAERLGLLLDALWTRIDLGRVLAERDAPRAIETLQRASGLAAEIGALTEQQITEKLLRSLGVRTWRRGRSTDPLTEREQAIVRLIAEGASNPEIAQQLFLSRKTVERHVSNVFKKVGVRNRAELAARVGELEVEGVPR